MAARKIKSALISVYHKDGLDQIVQELNRLGVTIYSTGGTFTYIADLGIPVIAVEDITSYPSILDGRVKTLHPKVFGGILAKRADDHLQQLEKYEIPTIDLIIVDLYPFEETLAVTDQESAIIEKIDIGGIALIRAAAKNYRDVVIIPSQQDYATLLRLLREKDGVSDLIDRRNLARRAFAVSSHYDSAIFAYFDHESEDTPTFRRSYTQTRSLRYGENPHQEGRFHGKLEDMFTQLGGKELSYNNLVDIDAAVGLMAEFQQDEPTFAILKHTNACGIATRSTVYQAWVDALAADNVSAFGGILISNTTIDLETAKAIDQIFYEVLIAPDFAPDALALLQKKKKRSLLRYNHLQLAKRSFKSLLNGVVEQDTDLKIEAAHDLETVTEIPPSREQIQDLLFANKVCKHLKSNTIVLARNRQLLAMGCGQTSRVDALKQAIDKAQRFGFDLKGAVMASDAFFPFPDCVEIADGVGIAAIIQPGGSIRDKDSINYCDANAIAMVTTGIRHFKH